jgi:hypothetical protein
VRYSHGPDRVLNQTGRDYEAEVDMPGLSVTPLTPLSWTKAPKPATGGTPTPTRLASSSMPTATRDPNGRSGQAIPRHLTFTARQPGQARLRLVKRRSWEQTTVAEFDAAIDRPSQMTSRRGVDPYGAHHLG